MHLTRLGGIFLPVLSGHSRTVHHHLVSSACPYIPPLSSSGVPSFWLPHASGSLPRPKSAASMHPATPTLASRTFTDGSVKSGWVLKGLFDFCIPPVPRPYGATGEKGRGSDTSPPPLPTPRIFSGHLLHGILLYPSGWSDGILKRILAGASNCLPRRPEGLKSHKSNIWRGRNHSPLRFGCRCPCVQ